MALPNDHATISKLLDIVANAASSRFSPAADERQTLPKRPFSPSAHTELQQHQQFLSETGEGFESTMKDLVDQIGPSLANSTGPRYFGLVVGGVTPAAFVADWVVTMYDQNAILHSDPEMSGYSVITEQAMCMVLDLFGLPREVGPRASITSSPIEAAIVAGQNRQEDALFRAMTTSGSTASNVVGMAVGRQWLGLYERGVDYGQDGYDGQVVVLTNMAHASVWKAASILGIGRKQVVEIPDMGMSTETEGKQEEMVLEETVKKYKAQGKAVMVFLAFGEVNTGIFPKNTRRIAEICKKYNAYFHIDGAFGIFARCSPKYAHLAEGLELAHSITACGHKWLNVPYDCGLFLYRRSLEKSVMEPLFSSSAAYLRPSDTPYSHPMNISIENSQRFRALPVWATLRAYGREGYKRIVEENCRFAKTMYDWMKYTRPDLYTVLTEECPLNIVVFAQTDDQTVSQEDTEEARVERMKILEKRNADLLKRINGTGMAYFSPTVWNGRPAMRAAISNWKTTVELDWEPVRAMLEEQGSI